MKVTCIQRLNCWWPLRNTDMMFDSGHSSIKQHKKSHYSFIFLTMVWTILYKTLVHSAISNCRKSSYFSLLTVLCSSIVPSHCFSYLLIFHALLDNMEEWKPYGPKWPYLDENVDFCCSKDILTYESMGLTHCQSLKLTLDDFQVGFIFSPNVGPWEHLELCKTSHWCIN